MVQKPSQVVEWFKNLHTGDVALDASPAAEAYVHDVTGTPHLKREINGIVALWWSNFMIQKMKLIF